MKLQRKLQVFISSTYTDMLDERQAVVEAILQSGHIPAGMELFAANNATQWETIKNWIDDSSVFLLVLGGRYGTIDEKSRESYIEMEFRYAVSTGKEVLAMVMSDRYIEAKWTRRSRKQLKPETVSQFAEIHHPEKLKEFRQFVRTGRIAPECNSLERLKLEVVQSLNDIGRKEGLRAWIPDTSESRRTLAISTLGANLRGIPIIRGILDTGLNDVENRQTDQNQLPPNTLYESVQDEVLVTGMTLKYTIDWQQKYIEGLLDAGKRVLLLMLDPTSDDALRLGGTHAKRGISFLSEGADVIDTVRRLGYLPRNNFGLRCYKRMPPYTGLLIDGNVDLSDRRTDKYGRVRVQPRTAFGIQHKGVVLEFSRIVGASDAPFDFFASDLRSQWADAESVKEEPG